MKNEEEEYDLLEYLPMILRSIVFLLLNVTMSDGDIDPGCVP